MGIISTVTQLYGDHYNYIADGEKLPGLRCKKTLRVVVDRLSDLKFEEYSKALR